MEENSQDFIAKPSLINIRKETACNSTFRTVLWTGEHLQVTVMSIPVGGEIGLERHDHLDQFIKIEGGCANVYMGECKDKVQFVGKVNANYAVIIPAGTWHNIFNACSCPLKLYSIYAPPQHPFGTILKTKSDEEAH